MSNVLKSKYLFGVMMVAAVVVAFAMFATSALAYTHTVTLKQGSTGSQVMSLQQALGVGADGSFGPITKAAVVAFQTSHGLTADGVVGPMTGAALSGTVSTGGSYPAGCTSSSGYSVTTGQSCAGSSLPAGCTSTSGYSPTTGQSCSGGSSSSGGGSLGSGDGDLTDFSETSSADSKFTEGETSELFAFEFEVEGDVAIDRVDIYLDATDGSGSENSDDFFGAAVLMVDGEEVATVDESDWDEDSYGVVGAVVGDSDEYRVRFSGLDLVFNDGDQPEFTLALEVNSSIDSGDLSKVWAAELETDSIRFVDGKGFSDEAGAALSETFSGEGEETAELKVTSSSEDPEATTIEVSDDDTTDEVEVFVFEIEEENGVDATINDLTVTVTVLTSAGAGTDESQTITDAYLYTGSTLLSSESVATGGVVAFENLDLAVDANDTVELTLKLTFADADEFGAGNTVSATISGLSDIDDAEDANGNDEGDMTLSGSATSETHSLQKEGLIVVFDDSSYIKTSSDTSGINETVEFTLEFDITAFGDDMYIDKSCTDNNSVATTYTTALVVSVDNAAQLSANVSCTDFDSTGDEETDSFEVLEGQTEHFTVTILADAGEIASAGSPITFTARLEAIGYNVGADGAGDTQYAFDLTDYKSSAVTVYDR